MEFAYRLRRVEIPMRVRTRALDLPERLTVGSRQSELAITRAWEVRRQRNAIWEVVISRNRDCADRSTGGVKSLAAAHLAVKTG